MTRVTCAYGHHSDVLFTRFGALIATDIALLWQCAFWERGCEQIFFIEFKERAISLRCFVFFNYIYLSVVCFFYLCFESTVNFPFYVLDSFKSIHSKQPNINETTKRKRMLLTTYYSRCFHVWTFNFQLSSLCFEVSNMGCFLCRFVCIKKTSLTSHFDFGYMPNFEATTRFISQRL